jgi:bacteriocin biosynthesis cyclodehydratase domain-containing protein
MASLPLDTRLCPADGLDLVLVSDDELLVQFGTRSRPSELFRDDELTGVIGTLVRKVLSGAISLQELLASVHDDQRDDARHFVQSLIEQGIIADIEQSSIHQYLNYTLTGNASVARRKVAIVGAGPVAARIAHNLLRQGIGRVRLFDRRPTDAAWLGAIPFGSSPSSDIGRPAHAALGERLRRMGYDNIDCVESTGRTADEAAIEGADLAILALEQPNLQLAHTTNRACIRNETPWLHVVIDGNLGVIGPQFISPDTACYNDYQALTNAAVPSSAMARRYLEHVLEYPKTSFFAGLPAFVDVVAGHASIAASRFLMCGTSPLVGRVMTVDFDGMSIDIEDVLKLPRCPVCATRRPSYRPPFPEGVETAA